MLEEVSKGRPDIQGVVYIEGEGDQRIVERHGDHYVHQALSTSSLKTTSGNVLTIIGQRYETGTDIPQKPNALADMSMRKEMTLRDGLQAASRMRKLKSAQNINILLSSDVKLHVVEGVLTPLMANKGVAALFETKASEEGLGQVLKSYHSEERAAFLAAYQSINWNEPVQSRKENFIAVFREEFKVTSGVVWRYFSVNQARAEQSKNWEAAKQKMREVIEKPLRQVLSDSNIPMEKRLELFEKMENKK